MDQRSKTDKREKEKEKRKESRKRETSLRQGAGTAAAALHLPAFFCVMLRIEPFCLLFILLISPKAGALLAPKHRHVIVVMAGRPGRTLIGISA